MELTAAEMAALDEDKLVDAMSTVDVLVGELVGRPKDIWPNICVQYTDLYLNPYYILSMRARIPKVRCVRAREHRRGFIPCINLKGYQNREPHI